MALKIVSGLDVSSISLSSFLDLAKNELRNAQIHNLTTTQISGISSPATGQFAFDTTLGVLKVYDGSAWSIVGADVDDSTIELSSNTLSVKNGGIAAAKLASSAVTTAKIAADAVTGAKIADNAINSEHYTDGSIDAAHIASDAVTTAKIAAEAVTSAEIQDRAVSISKLAAASGNNIILGRITADSGDFEELTAANVRTIINVADGATANAGTVTSVGHSAAGGINLSGTTTITGSGTVTIGTTGNLQDLHGLGVVDAANKFIVSTAAGTYGYKTAANVRTILNVADGATANTGALADLDTVSTTQIDDNAVTAAKISADAVDTSEIRNAAVTTAKLADDAVTGAKIDALTIGTGNIAAGAITLAKLATDSVNASKIAANAVGASEIAANAVGASELNVSGNGNSGQVLASDGDGTFSWVSAGSDVDVNVSNLDTRLGELGNTTISQSGSRVTIGGDMTVSDSLTIGGNLTVSGTTTTVNSTTVTVDDPIFTLGGDTAPSTDDNKDRGIEFRYHDGTNAQVGFFGWDDSISMFTGYRAATNTSEVFSGTLMNVKFNKGHFNVLDLNGTVITATGAEINILDGVTATASEINILDGVTASTSEINILDGVTATTTEINKLDGVTATTSELNILDGVTATAAEINKLDGFTGTAADLNYAKDLKATGVTTAEFDKLDGLTSTTAELNKLDGFTGVVADLNYAKDLRATGVTASEFDKLDGLTASTSELNIMDGVTATTAEINKLDGVTVSAGDINTVTSRSWAYTATGVSVTSGTATIAASNHDVEYPAHVQVYDDQGQFVLCDVRQTPSGDNDITINAADGTYDVVITGKYRPVA